MAEVESRPNTKPRAQRERDAASIEVRPRHHEQQDEERAAKDQAATHRDRGGMAIQTARPPAPVPTTALRTRGEIGPTQEGRNLSVRHPRSLDFIESRAVMHQHVWSEAYPLIEAA